MGEEAARHQDDANGAGIAARLIIGLLIAPLAGIAALELLPEVLVPWVPWLLAGLATLWVTAGAARDDGGWRKAGPWALLGIGLVTAVLTLGAILVALLVYVVTFYYLP